MGRRFESVLCNLRDFSSSCDADGRKSLGPNAIHQFVSVSAFKNCIKVVSPAPSESRNTHFERVPKSSTDVSVELVTEGGNTCLGIRLAEAMLIWPCGRWNKRRYLKIEKRPIPQKSGMACTYKGVFDAAKR